MSGINKLYLADNITIQKSINIENDLFETLKKIQEQYNSTFSDLINICIEDLISSNEIKYYAKPSKEILIYKSIMIRKNNLDKLQEIKENTGISITRLVNMSMKRFIDNYNGI